MAIGGLAERLAFILELDADGALSGFRRVGDTAEKELGRADNRLDKIGGRMQVAGAGALAFAGVAGRALFSFAQQSEEANLAHIKLQNSIEKNPKLAGENIGAFTDLADAIQATTAADGDAIVAGMSMLGTFKVTGDQLREITPLVVDYARKFGIDMVDANAQVGKALDGQIGTLKRNGVSIDETMFKTDRFRAVTEALARQVGGFAEAEGATFSGRLQRLKNEMGDLAEGVGVGAVDAFEDMIGPATKAADRLGDISPNALSAAGGVAAWGTATIGAIGATSVLAGTVIKMRERFQQLDPVTGAATGKLNNFGKVAAGLGIAGTIAGLVQMGRSMSDVSIDADTLTTALRDTTDAGKKHFDAFIAMADSTGKLDNVVRDAAATDMVSARALVARAEAIGLSSEKIAELRDILDEKKQADITGRENQAAYNDELDKGTDVTENNADAQQDLTDKLKAQKDALEALTEATIAQFDSNLGYRKSIDATEESLSALATTQKEHGQDSEEYRDQLMDAEGAILSQADAAVKLADDQAKAAGQTLSATDKNALYRSELAKVAETLAPGSPLRVQLEGYIGQLDAVPEEIKTKLLADAGGAFATVREFLAFLDTIGISSPTGHTVLLGFKQQRLRAAGGDVPPGGVIVGDGGLPELLERDAGGGLKVLDGQRTRSRMMSGGDGGVVVHIDNFNAGTMTPDAVARALLFWRVAG